MRRTKMKLCFNHRVAQLFVAALLILASMAPAAETSGSQIPIPSAQEILRRINKSHPRLLASSNDFVRLKARIESDSLLRSWQAALNKQANDILTTAPSRYEIPDGLRLLETSRRVLNRIYTLALLYRLEGEKRYAERAWQELEAAANFKDWNPRHFLDTAEMTHAFAIGYDWLYDAWSADQRAVLRRAILEKGFKPALTLYRTHSGWTRARHNWNQVCNGGIGIGALALADVEPEICGEILHSALESIQLPMAEFAPNGAWKEGPGYWNYATSYNVTFLAALNSALGTDFDLPKMMGFRETGLFPIYLTGPIGRTFNYADGGDRTVRAPQLFWFARKFNQPVFAWAERQVAAPSPLDLLWFDGEGNGPKSAGLALDKYFRGVEVVTLRSDWENSKALFLGFKAGDNKANHSHLDLGSFVFDAMGARWAVDLGSDDYNLPGYFGGQRWNYYRLRAEGQNTLVINPGAGPDQEPGAAARMIRFESRPERSFGIADLSQAYRQNARKVWRGIALLDRQKLLIQDEIQAEKPADIWWFLHTPADIKHIDVRSIRMHQLGVQVRADILSPEGAIFEFMDAQPLPSSPHPERQAKNANIKKLAVHLKDVKETRIAILLTPVTDNQPIPGLKVSALSEW
jgi:Heparinase II/III-like protein/Domain of unknown function (DUF4962)